jgi:hypothetical protein
MSTTTVEYNIGNDITVFFVAGLELEGIYRVSAPKSRLDELERLANVASDTIHFNDAHDAAGLLKRFLRQLPEHVLTSRLRDSFERAAAGEILVPILVPIICRVSMSNVCQLYMSHR